VAQADESAVGYEEHRTASRAGLQERTADEIQETSVIASSALGRSGRRPVTKVAICFRTPS